MKQLARHWRDEITIAAVLAALAGLVATGGWAWRLDRLVYDLGLALWTRPAPADIVIVAIDDASVEAIGRWPWRRAVHATLLQKIAAAKPRAVALDLVLSEPDADPAQDRLLALAIAHAAPVVLPVAGAPPDPALRGGARLGSAEPSVDADGVLRHAYLKSGQPSAAYPHLAAALLEAGGERVHPNVSVENDADGQAGAFGRRDGRLLIRYAGPPGTVRRLSYVDLLTGAVPVSELSGRYVLIGMTAIGLGDTLATPVNAHHRAMPGVEVLANVLYTLKSGDTVRPLADGRLALLSALALAALMAAFGFFGARVALPLALGSVPLAVAISLLALRGGSWASPVPYALGALLAYPLWSWRRLERAVAGMDAEIQRLAAEPLVAAAEAPLPRGQARDAIARRLHTLQSAGAVLRQARRFLAETVAAMPTAMLVADAEGRVLLGNTRAAALFDVEDAGELQGLDLQRLLGEFKTAAPLSWPTALAALQAGSDGMAVEARGTAGGDFVVHVAAVELQGGGGRGLLVSVADVEPVKQAQREREEALAFVSHDLRAPASSIVLLADMQLQGSAPQPPDELLREVRRLAARTLDLSEDFVRAAQAQTRPLQLQAVAVPTLLEEALADHRAQAAVAGVTLQLVANQAEVRLDRLLVARAIGNLVSNAIKHAPRDSRVEISVRADATQFSVQVLDAGVGLNPAQMAQLAQGEEGGAQGAAVRDARGVGLGLLFVQRVARRHGGRLRALPPPQGTGACFRLELPA